MPQTFHLHVVIWWTHLKWMYRFTSWYSFIKNDYCWYMFLVRPARLDRMHVMKWEVLLLFIPQRPGDIGDWSQRTIYFIQWLGIAARNTFSRQALEFITNFSPIGTETMCKQSVKEHLRLYHSAWFFLTLPCLAGFNIFYIHVVWCD